MDDNLPKELLLEIRDALDDHCVFIENKGFEVAFGSGKLICGFSNSKTQKHYRLVLEEVP